MQRCTGTSPNTDRTALRSAFDPSSTNNIPCSGSRPRSTRSESSAVATVAFSVLPSHSPSGIFTPSVVIPSATTLVWPLEVDPVDHHHRESHVVEAATHERLEVLARSGDELAADRRLRRGARRGLDLCADGLARALEPARRDAGEHLLEHQPRERIAVGEVPVGLKLHLRLAVRGANPRALHPDAA